MFVWIDLETTGLDPTKGVILEVACIITDRTPAMNTVGVMHAVVRHQIDERTVDPYVLDMHSANGLWDEVSAATRTSDEVADALLEFIKSVAAPRHAMLAGSSVHFDRAWMAHHWPQVTAYLHHRLLDVSTVKELVKVYYGSESEFREEEDAHGHRAQADIHRSLRELRYYKERYFK